MYDSRLLLDKVYLSIAKPIRKVLVSVGIIHPALPRFITYSIFGITTFLVDLGLLWIFLDVFKIPLFYATSFSFLIAISLNYFSNRRWVFSGTSRNMVHGYIYFLGIASLGLMFILGLVWLMVHKLKIDFVIARIIAAALVGIWNFLMNKFLNLKL